MTAFQSKCFDRIHTLQRSQMTIVIVSHDLRSLQNLCDRLIWVNYGEKWPMATHKMCCANTWRHMRELEQARVSQEFASDGAMRRWGSGEVKIEAVRILGADGQETQQFSSSDPLTIELHYYAPGACGKSSIWVGHFFGKMGCR
ncbi:MAG: Wzt carbohydrate-binding domain-containing protein [Chloroflexi bacterium]|nr:Wzt carbohydrate-binding domain-containing protein [Chloroflexota bacterium]